MLIAEKQKFAAGPREGSTCQVSQMSETWPPVTAAEKMSSDPCTGLGGKVNQAVEAVGAGMENLGHTIRAHQPTQGVIANVGTAVANKLETGGRYLEQKGFEGIGHDVTKLIRNNPVPALLIGAGVGFLLARLFRS